MTILTFPKNEGPKGAVLVSDIDNESATIRIQHEHLVEAIIMYLSAMPFGIGKDYDIIDVDLGVDIDDDGYVEMDVYFPLSAANDDGS